MTVLNARAMLNARAISSSSNPRSNHRVLALSIFTAIVLSACNEKSQNSSGTDGQTTGSTISTRYLADQEAREIAKEKSAMIDKREERENRIELAKISAEADAFQNQFEEGQKLEVEKVRANAGIEQTKIQGRAQTTSATMSAVAGVLGPAVPAVVRAREIRKSKEAEIADKVNDRAHELDKIAAEAEGEERIERIKAGEVEKKDLFEDNKPIYQKNVSDWDRFIKLKNSRLYKELDDAKKELAEAEKNVRDSDKDLGGSLGKIVQGKQAKLDAIEGRIRPLEEDNAIVEAWQDSIEKNPDGSFKFDLKGRVITNPSFAETQEGAKALAQGSQAALKQGGKRKTAKAVASATSQRDFLKPKSEKPTSEAGALDALHDLDTTAEDWQAKVLCTGEATDECPKGDQKKVEDLFNEIRAFAPSEAVGSPERDVELEKFKTTTLTKIDNLKAGWNGLPSHIQLQADATVKLLREALANKVGNKPIDQNSFSDFAKKRFPEFKQAKVSRDMIRDLNGSTELYATGTDQAMPDTQPGGINFGDPYDARDFMDGQTRPGYFPIHPVDTAYEESAT